MCLLQACKEEFECLKKRWKTLSENDVTAGKQNGGAQPTTCTQAERDTRFGLGWRWNTRNCASLESDTEVKQCRRAKRMQCEVKKLANGFSREEAKSQCSGKKKSKKSRSRRRRPKLF